MEETDFLLYLSVSLKVGDVPADKFKIKVNMFYINIYEGKSTRCY